MTKDIVLKSRFIFDTRDTYVNNLKVEEMFSLFQEIEMPLTRVLADMEYFGVKVDSNILDEIKKEAEAKLEVISKEI